jgi:hypothetical protein
MQLLLEDGEGFLRATFKSDGDEAMPRARVDELVAVLRERAPRAIHVMCDFGVPGQHWPKALEGVTLPSIEAFVFDTFFQTQTRQGANTLGDLRATFVACPNLQRLFASGKSTLSPVEHGALRELCLCGDPLAPALVKALGACKFPKLERLAISLASDAGPVEGTAAIASVLALAAPALREVTLSIEGADDLDEPHAGSERYVDARALGRDRPVGERGDDGCRSLGVRG